jgi:DNA polymerase III epsilon subunit family exonuclease
MKRLGPELLHELGLDEFVALDLETTGLDPQTAEILELGAVRFVAGEPKERFSALVRPTGPIPDEIVELTGITPVELERAPPLEALLPHFLEFLAEKRLVAHNAPFDWAFLEAAAARSALGEVPPRARWLDTLAIARALYPRLYSHKLEAVAGELGLPLSRLHRAAADAERVGLILLKLLERGLEVGPAALESLSPPEPAGVEPLLQGAFGLSPEPWPPRPVPVPTPVQGQAARQNGSPGRARGSGMRASGSTPIGSSGSSRPMGLSLLGSPPSASGRSRWLWPARSLKPSTTPAS